MGRVALPPYLRFALTGGLARVAILAAQLLSVRVLLDHLGTTQYAAFAVINGAASWGVLLDFGLGPAVELTAGEARARGGRVEPIVRAAAHLVGRWLPVALLLVALAGPLAQPLLLRPLGAARAPQSPLLLAGVAGLVVLTAQGGIGYRVFYATGRASLHHLYTALAALASLGGLLLLAAVDHGRALAPALLVAAAPAACFALLAFVQAVRGTSGPLDAVVAGALRARARRHLGLALLSAAVLQVDYLVMSQTLGPREIVTYTLLARVFGVILTFHGILLGSAWPELTAALARGDRRQADIVIRRSLTGSLGLVGVGGLTVAVAADRLVVFFTSDPAVAFARGVVALFAASLALRVWSDVHTYALLAMGRFRVLWWSIPAQAAVSVVAQTLLSRVWGIHGIVAGLALSFLAVAWVAPLAYRRAWDGPAEGGARR